MKKKVIVKFNSWLAASALLGLSACDGCGHVPEPAAEPIASSVPSTPPAPRSAPRLIAQTPHDPAAFTQGLLFASGSFLEGTGQYRESTLRRVEPSTGRVVSSVALPATVFGEGLARLGGELFQLTWRENTCFVYDENTFAKKRELHYDGEGWGLAAAGDGTLVMSDGTAILRFREPGTFREVRNITVRDGVHALENLNELEVVHGEILANVWMTSSIVRIDPASGHILGYLDLSALPEPSHADDPDAVLNGIAYDDATNRLFVTGKRWRNVYEIAPP